jgi:diguanylate cyclase (GGDEF)-like protein
MKTICGYPPRLFGYATAIVVVALPVLAGAAMGLVSRPPGLVTFGTAALFFGCALGAELRPVPLDVERRRMVSLAFVFVITAQTLLGWEWGVVVSTLAIVLAQVATHTALLKVLFNGAVYAVASGTGSLLVKILHLPFRGAKDVHYGILTGSVFIQGAAFVSLNVLLVCLAIAMAEAKRSRYVIADHFRHSGPAFVIMGFLAALAVALWTVEPVLLLLLAGPLATLGLYQRYALSTRVAERAATTDSLTALKNHRAYKHAIAEAVGRATAASPLALCLVDIDDFKGINDRHGHPQGDAVLAQLAALLARVAAPGEAFRLGGDEFAVLIEGDGETAAAVVEEVQRRLPREIELTVTVSAGIASCPESAQDADELHRLADLALYWTKRHGKNRWCHYSATVVELSWSAEIVATAEHEARLRAAENLIRVVDARDTYSGAHSQSVARLAVELGSELGLDETRLEHLRLAALLHDLGKIAISDEILQKPMQLSAEEMALVRRHPEIGCELLDGLGVAPVDDWILHHHEHWDGSGYPDRLRGPQIPLGSRIILVADAFDALTTDRTYRLALPVDDALDEIQRASGRQFDPKVVEALMCLERYQSRVRAPTTVGAIS